jgi:ribosomal protein S18 acetylase RimI-like enzyme
MVAAGEEEAVASMCVALNAEDPGPRPVPPEHMRRTLALWHEQPARGCCLVLERDGRPAGYSLVVPFWSNELGGEVLVIDELYVAPSYRSQGEATKLIEALAAGTVDAVPRPVALALEVAPDNARARRLYERLGFRGRNTAMTRILQRPCGGCG